MERCFLSNIGKDRTVKNELDSTFPNQRLARRGILLTSRVSNVELQFSEDYNKRSFDPCVLLVLISIRLSPTVRITLVGFGQQEYLRPLESQFIWKKKAQLMLMLKWTLLNVKSAFYFLMVYIVCLLTSINSFTLIQIMFLELVSIVSNCIFFSSSALPRLSCIFV